MAYEMILTALADPTRRALFEDLAKGEKPVAHLARNHPVSRPAVSQHLKVLELAGLVEARASGTSRIYSTRPDGLAPLRAWLDNMWGDVLEAFAEEVEKQHPEPKSQQEKTNARTRHQDD